MIARYRDQGSIAYVRILAGGKSGRHLHVDCALGKFFTELGAKPPKTTIKKLDIVGLLEMAVGSTINVGVVGCFLLDLDDLPEPGLIRSLAKKQSIGKLSVRLTEGTFSISGAPVTKIDWMIPEGKGTVRLQIRAEKSMRIEKDYLPSLLTWVEGQLQAFVLARTNDESA